jgi:hypothetical protein
VAPSRKCDAPRFHMYCPERGWTSSNFQGPKGAKQSLPGFAQTERYQSRVQSFPHQSSQRTRLMLPLPRRDNARRIVSQFAAMLGKSLAKPAASRIVAFVLTKLFRSPGDHLQRQEIWQFRNAVTLANSATSKEPPAGPGTPEASRYPIGSRGRAPQGSDSPVR